MSIEWLTRRELEDRLLHSYPPPGLWLRSFFSGRLPDGIDLRTLFDRAPEFDDWLPGLAVTDGWTGVAEGVPFVVAGAQNPRDGRWGFELSLPVRVQADGRRDVGWLLRAAVAISPALQNIDKPSFATLPFAGPGWALAFSGYTEFQLFTSPAREDALEVLRFIEGGAPPGTYSLLRLDPGEARWIVAGPRIGDFISRVSVCASEEIAQKRASDWSAASGVPFTVQAVTEASPAPGPE